MNGIRRLLGAVPIVVLVTIGSTLAVPAQAATATLTCGAVVKKDTTLAADVGPCTGPGLIIAADGITLDLNGHRVVGKLTPMPGQAANASNASGILFRNTRGSKVMNGEVTRFSIGVKILRGAGNRVTGMNVHDNIGRGDFDKPEQAGDGIAIYGSDRNRIDNNRVVHNGSWSGITLLSAVPDSIGSPGSAYNQIVGNTVLDNNIPMFDEAGTPVDKRDIGIAIEGPGAHHNQIVGNVVNRSGTNGIQVFPACSSGYDISTGCPNTVPNDHNVIANNRVNNNGVGAPAEGALGDGIIVTSMGPEVVSMPRFTIVANNTTNGNQRNGITLGGGNGQELGTGTWTTGGESYGCFSFMHDPDDPVVDNPELCGVNDTIVSGNTSSGNGIDGIFIGPRSDRNRIVQNTTNDNGLDGIGIGLAVAYGPGQLPMLDPQGNLIFIPGSGGHDNVLTQNTAKGNARWDGFDQNPGCDNNNWFQNFFVTVNRPCVK